MSGIAPGWYPDPDPRGAGTATLRWWDGERWTDHLSAGGPSGGGPDRSSTPDGEELAGWGRRLAAAIIDGIVTSVASWVLAFPFLRRIVDYYLDQFRASMDAAERGVAVQQPSPFAPFADLAGPFLGFLLVSLAVVLGYHGAFLRWRGATPGKLLLGLRVRLREAPGRLPWSAIAKRMSVMFGPQVFGIVPVVGFVISLLPFLDGLWPLWDAKRQALHDKAAGTNVVRTR